MGRWERAVAPRRHIRVPSPLHLRLVGFLGGSLAGHGAPARDGLRRLRANISLSFLPCQSVSAAMERKSVAHRPLYPEHNQERSGPIPLMNAFVRKSWLVIGVRCALHRPGMTNKRAQSGYSPLNFRARRIARAAIQRLEHRRRHPRRRRTPPAPATAVHRTARRTGGWSLCSGAERFGRLDLGETALTDAVGLIQQPAGMTSCIAGSSRSCARFVRSRGTAPTSTCWSGGCKSRFLGSAGAGGDLIARIEQDAR